MQQLLFDPQLYLAELDVNQATAQCTKLATYPWFGVKGLSPYDKRKQTQAEWKRRADRRIPSIWPASPPSAIAEIQTGVRACIDLQVRLDCEAVILPSPLTHDPTSPYDSEIVWLDEGLAYARTKTTKPVYATVALADVCLRYTLPEGNSLLDLIADVVSARGADGVYLVVEQGSEPQDARQCANSRVLGSVLRLIHLLKHDCSLAVVVNFLGAFGVVCQAVGAVGWSCGWYKSLHRLRLADQGAPGRAYPSYWTKAGAFDVSVDADFDKLVRAGLLAEIADRTPASEGLLTAAEAGVSSNDVGAWAYAPSNVTTCTEHYFHSAIASDAALRAVTPGKGLAHVEDWLTQAASTAARAQALLGGGCKSKTNHVQAWLEALRHYRRTHSV
jgi:hypothetical protein